MWPQQDSHSADTPEEGSEKVDADTLSVDNSGDSGVGTNFKLGVPRWVDQTNII